MGAWRTDSDLLGKRYGRLVVVRRAPRRNGRRQFVVRCDCGTTKTVFLGQVGRAKSCGCLRRELNRARFIQEAAKKPAFKHGMVGTPTYNSWASMKQRCLSDPDYAGRGIQVCRRWQSFEKFLQDMGVRPNGRTLDRINNDGHYEPSNCRWATAHQQRMNRRDTAKEN